MFFGRGEQRGVVPGLWGEFGAAVGEGGAHHDMSAGHILDQVGVDTDPVMEELVIQVKVAGNARVIYP